MNSDGHRTRTLPLIVVLGVITAFDAMAIDLYLPGFRDIGRSLGANPGTMQTSLSCSSAEPLSDNFSTDP